MKEILGGNLDRILSSSEIDAAKKYESPDNTYQVWEMSDSEFEKLCEVNEGVYMDNHAWWRSSKGSSMGNVLRRYNINNHYIYAWDGHYREDLESKDLKPDDRYFRERKYEDLLSYFCDEIGASQPRNICALAVDLARQNGMTMAELFSKYQG